MKADVKVLEVFFNVFMIEKHCLNNFCSSENKHNELASSSMKKCIDFDVYLVSICLHVDRRRINI